MNVKMWQPQLGEEEKRFLAEVIDSGMLTEGEKTREFEKRIAEFTGSKYAIAVTSGGVALYLGLKALDIGAGDEVIVPDYQMAALFNAVIMTGAIPVLVDVNRTDGNISVTDVKEHIKEKTKCIALVHMNGRYANVKDINELAEENGVMVLEDSCQSLGSFYKGKHLGTFSSLGCLSFHPTKIITTGCGGMILTDHEEILEKVTKFKDYGRIGRGSKELQAQVSDWGLNFRLTEMQAAVGLAQLTRLQSRIARVKEIYSFYRKRLRGCTHPSDYDGYLPWVSEVQLIHLKSNASLQRSLKEEYNIETRMPYTPIHVLRSIDGDFAGADYRSSRGLWLPTRSTLANEALQYVIDSFNVVVGNL